MEKKTVIKSALSTAAVALALFVFFRYIMTLILPFLIALSVAAVLSRPISLLHARTKIPKKALAGLLVFTVIALTGFVLFLICDRMLSELLSLFSYLSENGEKIGARLSALLEKLSSALPFAPALSVNLGESVGEVVKSLLGSAASALPKAVSRVISMVPHILIFTVIIILASYYFCAELDKIKEGALSLMPPKVKSALFRFKARLKETGIKYLRACLFMLIITYFELLAGFLVLGIPYSFTLALLIAAVDMLPILGVGTVLVPWAIWCKISGDTYLAVGLIIIFVTVTLVRRFTEPKIIGTQIGLHPLTTLFAMYIGFRLFGITGLLLSPLAAILILHALPKSLARKLGFSAPDNQKTND